MVVRPKPVLFLDVDGVLWDLQERNVRMIPSMGALEFLLWAAETCEVRWLTSWAVSGTMHPTRVKELVQIFDGVLSEDFFNQFNHSRSWKDLKCEAIDLNELKNRQWFWVEDELLDLEKKWLASHESLKNWILVDVFRYPHSLEKALVKIKNRILDPEQ